MTRRPARKPGAPLPDAERSMTLLDMRDELNVARDFLVVIWLANASPLHAGNGSALCTVASAAREKFEAVGRALDEHIIKANASKPT